METNEMEINREYLQKYLHQVAIEQLMADYQSKGYQVSKQDKIGKYHPDLVARKGNEVVIVEVKAGKMTADKRKQVAQIADFVRTHENHKFLVVLANAPRKKQIDIPNIRSLLFDYLQKKLPVELAKIPAKIQVISVKGVMLNEVTVHETGDIIVQGSALIEAELRYGTFFEPPNNDSIALVEIFPFTFDITLTSTADRHLIISEVQKIVIDTSAYDEE